MSASWSVASRAAAVTLAVAWTAVACGHAARPNGSSGSSTAPGHPAASAEQRELAKYVAKIEAVSSAYYDKEAEFTADNAGVLFNSDREGSPQVYRGELAAPAAPPKRLSRGDRVAVKGGFTRDGKYLFYLTEDPDGGRTLWRAAPDGSHPLALTSGPPMHREPPALARSKPQRLVYSARALDAVATQIVVQDVEGGASRSVYTDPVASWITTVTPEGTSAILLRQNAADDVQVLRVDLETGRPTVVFPRGGKKTRVSEAAASATGKAVFVGTDEGTEHAYLLRVDLETGAELARYEEKLIPSGEVLQIAVSPKNDRIGVVIDAGNRTELRFLDATTLAFKCTVPLPLGAVFVGLFSDDGSLLGIEVTTADYPHRVLAVDVATCAARPLRADRHPEIEALRPITARVVQLKAHDGLTFSANVYVPAGVDKAPVVVLGHPGPLESARLQFNVVVRALTNERFVVVEPNVRGSTAFGRAFVTADDRERRFDAIHDVATAADWARTQPWCDHDRVAVAGFGYGGYLALMAGALYPDRWRVVANMGGPSDLARFVKDAASNVGNVSESAGLTSEFGDPERDHDLLVRLSPLAHVARIKAPVFTTEEDELATQLRRAGIQVEVAKDDMLARALRFLVVHLTR